MRYDLEGQVALISGAGGGIGGAVAHLFAEEGIVLGINDLDPAAAERVATAVGGLALPADVTRRAEVEATVKTLVDRFGRLDILVNSAGDRVTMHPLQMTSDEEWHHALDLYLTGTFNCLRAVLPVMLHQRGGRIVNVSSICGLAGCPGAAAYSAAKSGVIGLTCALAQEVAHLGITANVVAPGFVETGFLEGLGAERVQKIKEATPLGRLGKAEEVASLVLYLVSQEAGFITGQTISVHGGYYSLPLGIFKG